MEALRKITKQLTQGISENNSNQSFIDSVVYQISNLFSKSAIFHLSRGLMQNVAVMAKRRINHGLDQPVIILVKPII